MAQPPESDSGERRAAWWPSDSIPHPAISLKMRLLCRERYERQRPVSVPGSKTVGASLHGPVGLSGTQKGLDALQDGGVHRFGQTAGLGILLAWVEYAVKPRQIFG